MHLIRFTHSRVNVDCSACHLFEADTSIKRFQQSLHARSDPNTAQGQFELTLV